MTPKAATEMPAPVFAPGWRFSRLDGVVLALGGAASLGLGAFAGWMGFVVAFTVGHFFLFCNLVRLSRTLELVWAALFVVLCSATIVFETPCWPATVALSLGMTLIVVVLEARKPSYHGVGWRKINPGLAEWWERRVAQRVGQDTATNP